MAGWVPWVVAGLVAVSGGDPVPYGAGADVGIVNTARPSGPVNGKWLSYSYVVSNRGPAAAPEVIFTVTTTQTVYRGRVLVAGRRVGCSTKGTVFVCPLGTLPKGSSSPVVLQGLLSPKARGAMIVTTAVHGAVFDPATAGNAVRLSTTVHRVKKHRHGHGRGRHAVHKRR